MHTCGTGEIEREIGVEIEIGIAIGMEIEDR